MHKQMMFALEKIFASLMIGAVLMFFIASGQTVKRGRDEGTASIPASNVMGNGNIDLFIASDERYSLSGFMFDPILGARIGISDMMELTGQFIPVSKSFIGPVEAHLQITTPGNDKLRFFGVALSADLFLSSSQDTISSTAQWDKPEYNPYLFPSLIADLDWLAVWKILSVKTYLSLGMVDNPELLMKYDQLSLRAGLEWKMAQHSAFACAGAGFYKEKSSRTGPGDASYNQNYFWIEPGGRYRLFGRFSIIGSVKLALFQNAKEKNPFQPELFKISVKAEAPLLFRETNTEAIRTLIFMERKKEKKNDSFEKKVASGKNLLNDMSASLMGPQDSLEVSDSGLKDTLKKRREETQKKMDEVEGLFRQLDQEAQPKAPALMDTTSLTGRKPQ
jgi:hypothetical protein